MTVDKMSNATCGQNTENRGKRKGVSAVSTANRFWGDMHATHRSYIFIRRYQEF